MSSKEVWRPGWQTAAEMEDEWYEANGYGASPPAHVVAVWADVREAEAAYRAQSDDDANAPDDAHPYDAPDVETTIGHTLPEVVIVPAHPALDGSGVEIELATLKGEGSLAVVAYSSLQGLVDQRGDAQPWVAYRGPAMLEIAGGLPVVLDPIPGVVNVVWTPERLKALEETVDE